MTEEHDGLSLSAIAHPYERELLKKRRLKFLKRIYINLPEEIVRMKKERERILNKPGRKRRIKKLYV
jgi:hypothetical protein